MTSASTRFFAFTLTLALCACAGVHWHKPDGDDAALARDLAACRSQAQGKLGMAGLGSSTSVDPRFGNTSGPSQADQLMQESQAVGFCMRDKGYVLVPDSK